MDNFFSEYIKDLIDNGYILNDGTPLKCIHCESNDIKFDHKSHIQGVVTEIEVTCNSCKNNTGNYYCGIWE